MRADEARAAIEALPLRDFAQVFGTAPIMILAPHADDEALGCGGMIALAGERGRAVHVVVLTDGGMSHPNSPSWPRPRLVARRREEALAATAILGVPADHVVFLDQPDGLAPHEGPAFARAVDRLVDLLAARSIGTLCATWIADPHGDHGAAARMAREAAARAGVRHLAYPVWAWTLPDEAEVPRVTGGARLDIAAHLPTKRRAIAAHATQHAGLIDDDPHGFALPDDLLARFERPWEALLEQP